MKFSALDIVALQDAALVRWHGAGREDGAGTGTAGDGGTGTGGDVPAAADGNTTLDVLVEAAHFANVTIWGLEDEARRRDVDDARIAAVKRAIDPWNQRRNDLMERIDAAIIAHHANTDATSAELHSETAGMIIDRLSILALKIRNMDAIAAAASAEADQDLAAECLARAVVLRTQRVDLAGCLARLFEDLAEGRRYFRLYRQMKSYNDERLNPALRRAAGAAARKA